MIRKEFSSRLKLAAIDLDGTLLGPDHQISDGNLLAMQRLQRAGLQVVLASGRHYVNMRKYADSLPDVQWLVSCQGGEVSDVQRKTVLNREFLPETSARAVLELGRSLGLSLLVYTVDGVFSESNQNSGLEFYTGLAGNPPRQIPTRELLAQPIFKMIWVGEAGAIDRAQGQWNNANIPLQAVRTHARLLEFMALETSKASALRILANRLEITPGEVVTFGDGDNDVPMFEWSGQSVAMPHGSPAAIRRAVYTAPQGPAETAFARGVDLIFEKQFFNRPEHQMESEPAGRRF